MLRIMRIVLKDMQDDMTVSRHRDRVLVRVSHCLPCLVLAIEGWIIFLTNIHEEAQEEDLLDVCAEYGTVKNFHMNVDRRTGFIKVVIEKLGYVQGYALVEYETFEDAQNAIKNLEGASILGQQIHANWAFVKSYCV